MPKDIKRLDEDKVAKLLSKVQKLITKYKMSVPELLLFYGNLGWNVGASIAGFQEKGPTQQELEKWYYKNPTVDVGLMIQGLLITQWVDDFLSKPVISSIASAVQKHTD